MKKTAKQKTNAHPSLQISAVSSRHVPTRHWTPRYRCSMSSAGLSSYSPISYQGSGAAQWYLCDLLIWNILFKCSQSGRCLFIFLQTKPNSSSCIMQCCLKNTSDTGFNLPFWKGNVQSSPVMSHQAWARWWGYYPAPCHRQTDRQSPSPTPWAGPWHTGQALTSSGSSAQPACWAGSKNLWTWAIAPCWKAYCVQYRWCNCG